MITEDPIRDLERQLVSAAARQTAAPSTQARRRKRWWLALPAVGALAAIAITLVALLRGGASTPSVAQAAYKQLNPGDGIVALAYDARWLDGGRLHEHVKSTVIYTRTRARTVSTSLAPRSGRELHVLEGVRTARQIRSYESGANTLTIQANCRRSGRVVRATTVDPIANFDFLYRQHRIREDGTTTFAGRRVARLVANEHDQQFVFLVSPDSGKPVAMTVQPQTSVGQGPFTGTVVRFLSHRSLPLDVSSRAQLRMRPHPGAKVIHLGRFYCPHR